MFLTLGLTVTVARLFPVLTVVFFVASFRWFPARASLLRQ